MILESIKGFILLDPLLTSYLQSYNYTGSPLHTSRRQNVQVQSPSKTKVNIELAAIKIIDGILRDESIGTELHNLDDLQGLLEVVSKAFRCMYSSLSKTQDYINVIKKHQVYVIKLIALKKIDVSLTELGLLYQVINKVVNVQSFINWHNPSALTYQELLRGIPFNETFLECLDENHKLQIVNLTIAFHFMCIQCFLQTITLNLKLIISNRDRNLNLSIFGAIAPYFLSSGNFSQWLTYSYSEFSNKDKHVNNLNKMINGFLKIICILVTKVNGSSLTELYYYQSLFTIKSIEYQLLKSGDYSNIQLDFNTQGNAELLPYIEDVKSVLSKLQGPSSVSLEKLRIELDCIKLPSTRYSRTDIISAVNKVIENTSGGSLDELAFYLLPKVSCATELASDVEFLSSMKVFINNMICSKDRNLAYSSIQICTSYFNLAFKTLRNLSCEHLTIFDSITIYIKDLINNEKGEQSFLKFISNTLQHLFKIFSKFRQFKRIRNLSNLFYNLGNKEKSLPEDYWKMVISYELFIYNYNAETKTTQNFKCLQSKLQKIVNALYEMKKFKESTSILLGFLVDVIDTNKTGFQQLFIDLAEFKMPLIIQLLAKCLVSDASIVNSIFGDESKLSENFKCIIFINIVFFLEKSNNVRQKTDLTNYIMKKLDLKDSTSKLICVYHYYNLNGLNCFVEDAFIDPYPPNDLSILFLSGVYLQKVINIGWDEDTLTNSLKLFEEWLERSDPGEMCVIDYEIEILRTLVNFLQYNSLTGRIICLIQTYKRHRSTISSLPKDYQSNLLLELELCDACIKLGLSLDASSHLTSSGTLLKQLSKYSSSNDCLHYVSNQDIMNWKLLQFEYCLLIGNKTHAKEKFTAILKFLDSKSEFNLKNQGPNVTLEMKFDNLFIIARFQFLTCKLNVQLSNFYDALDNVKLSIKVLYSIIKKLGNNIRKIAYNEMKWKTASLLFECYKTIIDIFRRLGISRDLLYYLLEFKKLDLASIIPFVNCSNSFYLSNYYVILDNLEDAFLSLSQGNNISGLILMDNRNIRYARLSSNVLFSAAKSRFSVERKGNNNQVLIDIESYKQEFSTLLNFSWKELASIPMSSLISMSSMIDSKSERIQLQYLLSLYELESTIDFGDLNHLETDQYSRLLSTIVSAKKQNFNASKQLLSIPCFSLMDESSIALPCIIKQEHTFQRSIEKNYCNISTSVDIVNNLIQAKEILINCLPSKRLTQLSNYELNDLNKVFFRCLSLLSSVAIFKSNFSLEGGQNSVLSYLYYLQDLPKYLPFLNDRCVNHETVTSQSNTNELLPSEVSDEFINKEIDLVTSDFFKDLADYLPSSWIIITLDICPYTGDLLLSKSLKDSYNTPFFLRIPLSKRGTEDGSPGLSFIEMTNSLKSIIKQSDISTRPETTSKIKSKEDRKNWWKLRFSLDLELKNLLDHVENDWLGGFKGIFDDPFVHKPFLSTFRFDFGCLLNEILPSRMLKIAEDTFMDFDDNVLELFLSMSGMFSESTSEISGSEFRHKNYKLLNDLIYFILDSLMYHGEQNAYDEIDIEKFHSLLDKLLMTYAQKKRRLLPQEHHRETHIIFVPSAECSSFPWESLNCLKGKSISRVPSIGILVDMLKTRYKSFNINKSDNLYYLINPGGDLTRTQTKFKPLFIDKENWEGLIGVQPDGEEILHKLTGKDLFIYLGHGGCEQFIRTSSLFKAACNNDNHSLPPSLLIGCSSGALNYNGLLEPNGNIYNWLTCGSPMVVVNLWDVTDKDIDMFSLSVFERWGLLENVESSNNVNICQAVGDSRQQCTLKYLNGSAPVVYGLPMLLK